MELHFKELWIQKELGILGSKLPTFNGSVYRFNDEEYETSFQRAMDSYLW